MDNIKVNALMLRATDYLENDKILTLLTAERGRISAGIKGVKKAGAKLKFAAQPFCFAEYILAERGGRYTVTQASECESFYELRSDVCKYYAACAVCEAAIALTAEGDLSGEIFYSCVRALRDMCSGDEGFALIKFLLSALRCSGYGITANTCSVCRSPLDGAEKLRFDMESGSFTCWGCGSGAGVSGITFKALLAAGGRTAGEISQDGKKRALRLLKEYIACKTDSRLNSLNEYIAML